MDPRADQCIISRASRCITKVLADKCLCDDFFRSQFIGHVKTVDHEHEDRTVRFYPEEVFLSEEGIDEIFFIPITLLNNDGIEKGEKIPIPIFMLQFTYHQKEGIKRLSKKKGLEIKEKYFSKPKISLTYEERLDRDLDLPEFAGDEFDSLTKFGYIK